MSAELKQSVRPFFRPMRTAYGKKNSSNKDHGIGPVISLRVFMAETLSVCGMYESPIGAPSMQVLLCPKQDSCPGAVPIEQLQGGTGQGRAGQRDHRAFCGIIKARTVKVEGNR